METMDSQRPLSSLRFHSINVLVSPKHPLAGNIAIALVHGEETNLDALPGAVAADG